MITRQGRPQEQGGDIRSAGAGFTCRDVELTGAGTPGTVTLRADSAQEAPSLHAGDGIAGFDTDGDAAGA